MPFSPIIILILCNEVSVVWFVRKHIFPEDQFRKVSYTFSFVYQSWEAAQIFRKLKIEFSIIFFDNFHLKIQQKKKSQITNIY